MNSQDLDNVVQSRLIEVLLELQTQTSLARHYPDNRLSFEDEMRQLHEYISVAGEYSIAYESIIATLEQIPFILSGSAAVKLLEVGLIMQYKSDRPQDQMFDMRK
jgi:hypothetical protein